MDKQVADLIEECDAVARLLDSISQDMRIEGVVLTAHAQGFREASERAVALCVNAGLDLMRRDVQRAKPVLRLVSNNERMSA